MPDEQGIHFFCYLVREDKIDLADVTETWMKDKNMTRLSQITSVGFEEQC